MNTTADVDDGNTSSIAALISSPGPDGKISLREAIEAANQDTATDDISFDLPTSFVIQLVDTLLIEESVNIVAANRGTLDANGVQAIYAASAGTSTTIDVTINNLNIINGNSSSAPVAQKGGAIAAVRTNLSLSSSALTNNHSVSDGGAVWVSRSGGSGSLVVNNVQATGNTAAGRGGAIHVEDVPLTVTRSKFSMNQAVEGGGIHVAPSALSLAYSIKRSYFGNNDATGLDGRGGGFQADYVNNSTIEIERVMFESNTAQGGGGGAAIGRDTTGGDLSGATGTSVTVRGATFLNNTSEDVGGGMSIEGDDTTIIVAGWESGTVTVPTRFEGNIAHGVSRLKTESDNLGLFTPRQAAGGGLFINTANSLVQLSDVDAIGNVTTNHGVPTQWDFGGQVYPEKYNDGDGGGLAVNVYGDPQLTEDRAHISVARLRAIGNITAGSGGGALLMATRNQSPISNEGSIHVEDSTFEDNCIGEFNETTGGCDAESADNTLGDGGGLYGFVGYEDNNTPPSYLSIVRSTFANNSASRHGGGAMLCSKRRGAVEVGNSTFSGNLAGRKSGSSGDAGEGGGLALAAATGDEELDARLLHLTITDNDADRGGGLVVNPFDIGADEEEVHGTINVTMDNSIVSDNQATMSVPSNPSQAFDDIFVGNIFDPLLSTDDVFDGDALLQTVSSGNVIGDAAPGNAGINGPFNQFDVDDPLLLALDDYGGFTKTRLLKPTSPAIDSGDDGHDPLPFAPNFSRDQRNEGFDRDLDYSAGGRVVDAGAAELSPHVKVVDVEIVSNLATVPNYDVPAGSVDQFRSVPQGSTSHGVKITLNREVNLDPSILSISDISGNANPSGTVTCAGCGANSYSGTWTYTDAFTYGNKQVQLASSASDPLGVANLAGDWNNPTGITCSCEPLMPFPSGHDHTNTSDFLFTFTILPADISQNNVVDFADFTALSGNFGFGEPLVDWVDGNLDLVGAADYADFLLLSGLFGVDLTGSCSCAASSSSAFTMSSGSLLTEEEVNELRRQEALTQFEQLAADGASTEILAMGLSLLEQTWLQTDAKKEWNGVEKQILSEIDSLDRAYAELGRELRKAGR